MITCAMLKVTEMAVLQSSLLRRVFFQHNKVANLDFSLFNERFLKELPPLSGPFASQRRHGLTTEKNHSTIRTGD